MLIQCTKRLLNGLNVKPSLHKDEDPLFCWHANLISLNRRKTIVLVNDKNRYVIVLYGLKAKDFKKLDKLILNAIRETFSHECIKDEVIEEYINRAGEVIYAKTKDKSSVARMNKSCDIVNSYQDSLMNDSIYQSDISKRASRYWVRIRECRYITPSEEMHRDLEVLSGKPIFCCKAAKIKVTLEMKKYKVWRKLIVPLNMTFTEFHEVLQAAFAWKDCHLHEFFIYGNDYENKLFINHPAYHKEGYKAIVNLVSDEEAFDYPSDVEMKFERGIKLSQYIPQYKRLLYKYDFGDGWQHYIEVEKIIDDYDLNYPVCLEGEGNAPPEDVGGEFGYEEFLNIISDKNDPEYEDMMAWGKR
ncbi:plasmid pRiA4b ORF-3 family protein [Aceticella autotrophica]|uniref:Plasmid pRiA4b ORF-3 family protein n=1 Tax=Aceticella autotrophica TaxID=2755338 RepID=A0A975AWP2_9THEO|nr:plasmid pRiA4b ORF-3 family protein [Aceticella autotrophica]QSZ27783.1 plasmid pRiA4b ORF-3 family protein [Aceticella autotrophica]